MRGLGGRTGASLLGLWLGCFGPTGIAHGEESAPPGSPLGYQRVDITLQGTVARSGLEAVLLFSAHVLDYISACDI